MALCATAGQGHCLEGLSAQVGVGNYVDVVGIGITSGEWRRWSIGEDWSLSAYGTGGVAYWHGRANHPQNEDIVDMSAAPVLRLGRSKPEGFAPYVEASIGVHLLSHTRINEGRQFSTAFQFGEFLGAGVTLGDNGQYDLGLRVQHVSNGGIRNPNDGLTYGALVFQCRFGQGPSGADSRERQD